MEDARGMYIFKMFDDNCDSFKIIAMASLSVLIEKRSLKVSNLILLRTSIATRPHCILGLSLHVIV